ncbi:MAG: cysteine synthase family protein [Dehalococcoidia bacterium]|nr:cysteine synthase family protein [Dehalococcoidia bacterium]
MRFNSIIEAIGRTPLVELQRMSPKESVRIYAKLEGQNPSGSVKDRIAKYMIEKAESEGVLTKDRIVLEPTSGNTGIALAMVARYKGYKVKVTMPENVSAERRQLLAAFGAEVILTDGGKGTNGAIEVAQELAKDDLYFMPYQYGNKANPLAHYETTGVEILQDLSNVDVFIAGLGTGGTLMGVARRLKEKNRATRVIAVVPPPDDAIQGLRRLEDGFIPPILDLSLLDGRMMVESKDAFQTTRDLMEREAIFAGISSGSVVHAAQRVAQRMESGNIVCLLADGGWKYLSTGLWSRDYSQIKETTQGKIWW